jgi:hypothetical protein
VILSIDPGRKPGYVLLDESQCIHRMHLPGRPALPLVVGTALSWVELLQGYGERPTPDRVVIEGQFGKISNAKRRSILTLAVEAGWQLCRAVTFLGGTPSIIHPQALSRTDAPGWRDALGVAHVTKIVVQNRVERSLLPIESTFFSCAAATRRGDCLDATAIGWGAYLADPKPWREPP